MQLEIVSWARLNPNPVLTNPITEKVSSLSAHSADLENQRARKTLDFRHALVAMYPNSCKMVTYPTRERAGRTDAMILNRKPLRNP